MKRPTIASVGQIFLGGSYDNKVTWHSGSATEGGYRLFHDLFPADSGNNTANGSDNVLKWLRFAHYGYCLVDRILS
jgi:hypothetical protein